MKITLSTPGCGPVFQYLVEKHKQLETINICFFGQRSAKDENEIVQTVFSHLNLRSITIYNMQNTRDILDLLPGTLLNLPNLEKLELRDWDQLSDQGLTQILITSRSSLRDLNLSGSNIIGIGLEEGVNSLPNLETLILMRCFNLKDEGLAKFLRISGSKLRVLNLTVSWITGIGLEKGVKSLSMLEKLKLERCFDLTDRGLNEILRISGSKLTYLIVADGISITGMGLEEGVKSLPMLEKLELDWCEELTGSGLKEILRISGSKLRELSVAEANITDAEFMEGLRYLPMLENLNLSWCPELTSSGLLEILRIPGSRLKTVYVYGTNISTDDIETLSKQYPSVHFEYLLE